MTASAIEWCDAAELAVLAELRELCRLAPHEVAGFVERRSTTSWPR